MNKCHGSSYVVDSLMSSLLCRIKSYSDTVKMAISFGNDTDTTACIAGGLAGITYGFRNIPNTWVSELRGKEIVYPLLKNLLETKYQNMK
jgi:ADP-ribosylglycohydrolase